MKTFIWSSPIEKGDEDYAGLKPLNSNGPLKRISRNPYLSHYTKPIEGIRTNHESTLLAGRLTLFVDSCMFAHKHRTKWALSMLRHS